MIEIMKTVWIVFVVVCIFIFTYFFVRTRNPITNVELYYHDATIARDTNIVLQIQKSYIFLNFYVIYIIKTLTEPQPYSSFAVTTYSMRFGDYYLVVLCSRRYGLSTFTGNSDEMRLTFSDYVIYIPYVSLLWRYHKFSIVLNRSSVDYPNGDIVVCGRNSNGPIFPEKLVVSEYHNVVMCDVPMKLFLLTFRQ